MLQSLKTLRASLRENGRIAVIAVLFVAMGAVCECILPFVMAKLIDSSGVDWRDIAVYGAALAVLAAAALVFGVFAGRWSARASAGFAANLREDMFVRVQGFSFSDGYDTYLEEGGVNLSGGQKQRLCIARAILRKPKVLILDDSTSSIDTRTEKIVQAGTDRLMEGRTTFVIAHRLSTVRSSDCILVLDRGRVVEQRSHEERIARRGAYYRLYTGAAELG